MGDHNTLNRTVARRVSVAPIREAEHFYTCSACGQQVDMRQLGDVFFHDDPAHAPIAAEA